MSGAVSPSSAISPIQTNPVFDTFPLPEENTLPLPKAIIQNIFLFLGTPKELANADRVCKSWKRCLDDPNGPWKATCQLLLGPVQELSSLSSLGDTYKNVCKAAMSRFLGPGLYEHLLQAKTPPAPPIISLKGALDPDPWDRENSKLKGYYWVYVPEYLEIITATSLVLDRPDDPNSENAPRLVERTLKRVANAAMSVAHQLGVGTGPEKRELQVPVTINNLQWLFQHVPTGNQKHVPQVADILDTTLPACGDKRIPDGLFCIREFPVGVGQTFAQQQQEAQQNGMGIASLGLRVVVNFLACAKKGYYPDGGDVSKTPPVRTSPFISSSGSVEHASCRAPGRSPTLDIHLCGASSLHPGAAPFQPLSDPTAGQRAEEKE